MAKREVGSVTLNVAVLSGTNYLENSEYEFEEGKFSGMVGLWITDKNSGSTVFVPESNIAEIGFLAAPADLPPRSGGR